MSVDRTSAAGPEWAEVQDRVRSYLAACGVAEPVREEITGQILLIARDRAEADSSKSGTEHAIESAIALIDSWIEHIVGTSASEGPGLRSAHERASVHLAQIPRLWPEHFLRSGEIPADLAECLRSVHVTASPGLQFSNMAPRPIDLGPVSGAAGSTWRTFDRWPALRAVAVWAIYIVLLALAFVAVRP